MRRRIGGGGSGEGEAAGLPVLLEEAVTGRIQASPTAAASSPGGGGFDPGGSVDREGVTGWGERGVP